MYTPRTSGGSPEGPNTFFWLLLATLFMGISGQLGESSPREDHDFQNSGNGFAQPDKDGSRERKVWAAEEPIGVGSAPGGSESRQQVVPIESTFIACVNGSSVMDSVTYINLTQVISSDEYRWGSSESTACFLFCKSSAPSRFISVQNAFQNSTQSCGCHDNFTQSLNEVQQDTNVCEVSPGFLKLYCGPTNLECLNSSGTLKNNLCLSFAILVLLQLIKKLLT